MTVPKILVIDDDVHVQSFLQDALQDLNYKVIINGDGKSGLASFNNGKFDYVLLDMQLPDTTGNDVLKEIKKISPKTIVIMITGHGSIENAVESMQLGAYNYLTKPISLKTLKAELERAKGNRQLLLDDQLSLETISINGVQSDPGFIKF